MPTIEQLNAQLDRLAAFDGGPLPVVSLYLDLRPNDRGRDNFEPFLRKELADRIQTYGARGPERESLEKDGARIAARVAEVDPALNGMAIFACSAADLFEVVPLAAPINGHRLHISEQPHLYPLARVLDQYPRYLALLADTNAARIFVFAVNAIERADRIESTRTRRHKMGGWAQARYQRHTDNYHLQHAKEVVDAVSRIARNESIERIIIAGDEVIVPLLREQLPKDIADRIVDVLRLDIRAPERDVLDVTMATLSEKNAQTDRERVEALLNAYRAGGLVAASPDRIDGGDRSADELIALARQTSAKARFISDGALAAQIRGVGAFLRFAV
jgi:peptide subunit release factor 1 (eRF1)